MKYLHKTIQFTVKLLYYQNVLSIFSSVGTYKATNLYTDRRWTTLIESFKLITNTKCVKKNVFTNIYEQTIQITSAILHGRTPTIKFNHNTKTDRKNNFYSIGPEYCVIHYLD